MLGMFISVVLECGSDGSYRSVRMANILLMLVCVCVLSIMMLL